MGLANLGIIACEVKCNYTKKHNNYDSRRTKVKYKGKGRSTKKHIGKKKIHGSKIFILLLCHKQYSVR